MVNTPKYELHMHKKDFDKPSLQQQRLLQTAVERSGFKRVSVDHYSLLSAVETVVTRLKMFLVNIVGLNSAKGSLKKSEPKI